MNGLDLSVILSKPPYATAQVLTKVSNDWCEVTGVSATGEHRNGIALTAAQPALGGGVIVVESDAE